MVIWSVIRSGLSQSPWPFQTPFSPIFAELRFIAFCRAIFARMLGTDAMLQMQHQPRLENGMKYFSVFDLIRPAMEASKIMADAQVVIGLRVAGMAGFWPMGRAEKHLMVAEKMSAGADAAGAVMRSAMAGGSLPDMAMAAMRPVRSKTKSNVRRLSRKVRGLK